MDLTYKIRAFDAANGCVLVEVQDFQPFNVDVPLVGNRYIEGQELDEYIRQLIPLDYIKRKQVISQGIENSATIAALVEPWPTPEPTTNETQTS